MNSLTFTIHLSRFNSDIDKVALLLEKYETDRIRSSMQLLGKNIPLQVIYLRSFPSQMFDFLDAEAALQGKDTFGNEYIGSRNYDYIEFFVEPNFQTLSFRFLGGVEKSFDKQDRYTIFLTDNPFDHTTLKIVSELRDISDSTTELFGVSGLSTSLRCGQDSNVLEGVVNNASNVIGAPAVGIPQNGIQSVYSWQEFVNKYFIPLPKIIPNSIPIAPRDLKLLSEKYDQNSIKTSEDVLRENQEIESALLKASIKRGREGSFELNNAGSEILSNGQAIRSNIQGAVGDPVAVLNACYTEIFDKFSLGCLLKSAAECIIPPLSCKEILRGLRVENLQERLELVFPNQPRVIAIVNAEIQKLRDENPNGEVTIDMVLDSIENFIDLEALCDAINFTSVGFSIPTIEIPELPIVDLFGQVTIEIENAILESLIQAIKNLILGILEDLASCDNLDAFIAGALDGEFGPDAGLAGDLANLFVAPGNVTDPNKGAVASSLGRRWDEFVDNVDSAMSQQVLIQGEVGASVGEIFELQTQINAAGGVEGIAKSLVSGTLDPVEGEILLEKMVRAELNINELSNYTGPGSENINNILKEIGSFQLNDDGNSFTLRRISDDQIVTIMSKASSKPVRLDIDDLSSVLSRALDSVIAVLSPGETLELLAGEPSQKTIDLVNEITRIRTPELSNLGDPTSLFVNLGEIAGLNQLKDAVILISQNDTNRDVPRKFCPEDDARIPLRKRILESGGLDPEEAEREIENIIEDRTTRYNDIIDILSSGGDLTPSEILDNIKCGTGFQPNGRRPKIVEDQINSTFNNMFEATKMTFDREVVKYVDAISTFKKVDKVIPKLIEADSQAPVLSNTDGNIFQSLTDFVGDITSDKKVNPEFKKMISEGFIPLKEDGSDDGTEGASNAKPKTPYSDGNETVTVKQTIRETGGLFKNGIKINHDDVSITEDEDIFSIVLKGKLFAASPVEDYLNTSVKPPEWRIAYKEKDGELEFRANNSGKIQSSLYGSVPFYENYLFSKKLEQDLTPQQKERLQQFKSSENKEPTRKRLFSEFLLDKIKEGLVEKQEAEQQSEMYFSEQYTDFIKDFLFDLGRGFANNRLLKKIPGKGLSKNGAQPNPAAQEDETQMILLNLISFSPTPTDEQRRCKQEPHLLDLEFIKKISKEQFDKECENQEDPNDGITASRKPINSAGFVGVVLTIARLYVVEHLFKSLFVFDEYGYREDFADEPLLIDYISFRAQEDLKRLGIWDRFEKELKIAYEKLVASGQLKVDTPPANDDGSRVISQSQGLSEPYSTRTRTEVFNGIPEQLKVLIKETMKSVMQKMALLVGVPQEKESSLTKTFMNSLDVYDTYSNFEYESQGNPITDFINPESNNKRFDDLQDNRGKFILERYVRIPESTNPLIKQMQQSVYLKDVVAINNWESFTKENLFVLDGKLEDNFNAPFKFGTRLVYITPAITGQHPFPETTQTFNKFKMDSEIQIDTEVSDKEKSLFFMEKGYRFGIDGAQYKQYNSVVISQYEEEISEYKNISDAVNLGRDFENKYKDKLLAKIEQDEDLNFLLDHIFFTKKLSSLMSIYSTFVLNTEDMKFLFEGTKLQLKRLFESMENIGDYTFKPDLGATDNAAQFQAKFNNIGNPAGPSGPDALYYATITPIMILKGLAELTDFNISITSKIVSAAAAGYFAPKLKRVQGEVRIQGRSDTLNFPDEIVATEDIFIEKEGTGELLVRSDVVVFGQDENGNTTRRLQDGLGFSGTPIIDYTKVIEPLKDEQGNLVRDINGNILPKTNSNGDIVVKSGEGAEGIPFPAGQESALSVDLNFDKLVSDLTLGNFGGDVELTKSVPIYPGESINLPYNLVAMAQLPINYFGLFIPSIFCGPPIGPLGQYFLALEPLIYRLPYFQAAYAKSDISVEIKNKFGINLNGKEAVKCEDEEK